MASTKVSTECQICTMREYLRVSKDKSGRERSPAEQHVDLAADAEIRGYLLIEPAIRDVGSASRYQKRAREGFDQLISEIQAARFGADILGIWEPRRGSRKVSEWLALIEACADSGVSVWVHTHNRLYDPRNGRDRQSLLRDAVDGEYDASERSEVIGRAIAANAVAGGAHGIAPYGYCREYTFVGSARTVRQVPELSESPIVREIFGRFRRGQSLRSIAADLNNRGVPTRLGKKWHQATVSAILRNPAYGGWRIHGEVRYEADWPALVPRAMWFGVSAILANPDRLTRRPGRGRHLLSGLMVCDVCDYPIAVRYMRQLAGTVIKYQCTNGHVKATRDEIDEVVVETVLTYMSDPQNYRALTEKAGGAGIAELAAVREQLAEANAEHAELAESGVSVKLAALKEPAILQRISDLEDRERELQTPVQLVGLLGRGRDVRKVWRDAQVPARRMLLHAILVPGVLGQVRLLKSPGGRRLSPAVDRIEFRRETGSGSPI